MLKLRSLVVLAVTTWAFVVCFAVWLMFGVTGIPISRELNLNGIQFGLLTSTPVLTGALFRLPLGIWTAALGTKDEQPAAYSPDTSLFYVPTNHVCMDYEPFRVSYTAGQPYVGATLSMYPPPGESNMGNFIAWDGKTGKIVWSVPEQFSVWSGALATAGGVVFYGTLEGYLKAVDAKTGKELYKFKTPSGIIGNVTTYEHGG